MPHTVFEIKERLVRVIDDNGNIQDMTVASDIISVLEKISVSKEDLEKTRLGRYVNLVRKAANDPSLAKRAKNLIKSWQQLIKQGNSQLAPTRTRPETPNSVGSSPSPPDVGIYNVKYVSKTSTTPPVFPQNHQSGVNSETLIKKSKKTKDGTAKINKGNRKKMKSPISATKASNRISPDIKLKSETTLYLNDKKSPDCAQQTVSVVNQNKNGIKLTFKMQNSSQSMNIEDDESEINVTTTGNGSQRWREDMLERTLNDKPKENKKKHKKKKSRSRSSDHSSPSSRTSQATSPTPRHNTHEDMYNNNKNVSGIITSQSESNLTVMLSPKKLLTKPTSTPDLKNHNLKLATTDFSPNQVNNTLKRKREHSTINHNSSSPELTLHDDRPRNKERRMTLTYDPHTRQLQQVEKQVHPPSSGSAPSTPKTTSPLGRAKDSLSPQSPKILPKQKQYVSPKKETVMKDPAPAVTGEAKNLDKMTLGEETSQEKTISNSDEFPTKLVPSVIIYGESSKPSGSHEKHRRFEKRKTRRKNDIMELEELFPISDSVTFNATDSESEPENGAGFCSSLSTEKTDMGQWTGVTGCRGNNGSWYDWLEMFCVRNNDNKSGMRLPDEEEILPLHVLPYIELD